MISWMLTLGLSLILQSSPQFKIDEIYKGSDVIWGLCFLSDQEVLFTEKQGRLYRLDVKTKKLSLILGLPETQPHGQGGLMDVQVHPNFSKNSLIYLTYSLQNGSESWTTRLARGRLEGASLKNVEVLFTANADSSKGEHFGSRLAFDRKGHVFVSVGDRGQRELAQSLAHHQGKIIRLREDGGVPKDNPFVNLKSARPEIWSYGHRNPQGLVWKADTNELWVNEHGPRGGDEINLVSPGKNYGWPVVTFGREYWGPKIGEGTSKTGMENPIHQFTPSIAPSSLMIYSGKLFKDWKGNFFSTALAMRHLNRVVMTSGKSAQEDRWLVDLKERFRHIAESADGSIYLTTDSGKILRLSAPSALKP